MPRPKRSPIWKASRKDLIKILERSETATEVLKHFGLKNIGNNYKTLASRLEEENLQHYAKNYKRNRTKAACKKNKIPIKEQLVENSTANRYHLKKKIVKLGLIEYKCSECGLKDEWNNKPITLQLDHINGINNDNRIENLRFICPNCHSQTETFAGKNTGR